MTCGQDSGGPVVSWSARLVHPDINQLTFGSSLLPLRTVTPKSDIQSHQHQRLTSNPDKYLHPTKGISFLLILTQRYMFPKEY